MPNFHLKTGTYDLTPSFSKIKIKIYKTTTYPNEPYQIKENPTDNTYKLINSNKKVIIQQRNNLLSN